MVLIFTGKEQLDKDLNKKIPNSRVVYYPDYVLEEKEATALIITVQPNKFNFKDFLFKVRQKDIQVILILENSKVNELKDALILGIYDIVFDPCCGSGSHLLAAKKNNRKFLGCEINKNYYQISIKKIL